MCSSDLQSTYWTLGLEDVPYLAELGRIVGDCLQHPFLVNAGSFGSTTDQGIDRADQDVIRADDRIRDLVDDDVLESFSQNLLH